MTNELISKYERYIAKLAYSLAHACDQDIHKDLEQEARIAVWLAKDKYVPSKGTEQAYFTTIIKFAMKKYLTNNLRIIRIPNHILHDEDPTHPTTISINTQIGEDSNLTIEDILAASNDSDESEHQEQVQSVLKELKMLDLPEYKKELFIQYYLKEIPMVELARQRGKTKQSISLHIKQVLKALQQ